MKEQKNCWREADSTTTEALLHNYIRDCDAVVYLIEERIGAVPKDSTAVSSSPLLSAGIARASYTQWLNFMVHHYNKRHFIPWSKNHELQLAPMTYGKQAIHVCYTQWLKAANKRWRE